MPQEKSRLHDDEYNTDSRGDMLYAQVGCDEELLGALCKVGLLHPLRRSHAASVSAALIQAVKIAVRFREFMAAESLTCEQAEGLARAFVLAGAESAILREALRPLRKFHEEHAKVVGGEIEDEVDWMTSTAYRLLPPSVHAGINAIHDARIAEGLTIDPMTAQVGLVHLMWPWDPYLLYPPFCHDESYDEDQFYARNSPDSPWVWFGHLPDNTARTLTTLIESSQKEYTYDGGLTWVFRNFFDK
jgi:hypothetical protein